MTKQPHKPTTETRDKVEQLLLCGEPRTDICIGLGISMKELEQHYRDELLTGAVHARHKLLGLMWEKATERSLPAIKELLDIHDRSRMVQRPPVAGPLADHEGRVNKKDAADFAAHNPDAATSMGGLLSRRMTN